MKIIFIIAVIAGLVILCGVGNLPCFADGVKYDDATLSSDNQSYITLGWEKGNGETLIRYKVSDNITLSDNTDWLSTVQYISVYSVYDRPWYEKLWLKIKWWLQ